MAVDLMAWLAAPSQYRNIIIKVMVNISGSEVQKKLSQRAYLDYDACLQGGLQYSESLPIGDGNPSLSVGSVDITNVDRSRDGWVDYVWENRELLIYGGDVRWAESDYELIFHGITARLTGKDRSNLSLVFSDKLQLRNSPIMEDLIGGSGVNKDATIPFLIGEVGSFAPVQISTTGPAGTGLFKFHPLPVEAGIEARDGGGLIEDAAGSWDLTAGTYYPKYALLSTLSLSAQGHKIGGTTFSARIGANIKEVLKVAGKPDTVFTDADLNLTQIAAFDTAYPVSIGYYSTSEDNILSFIQKAAGSVEAFPIMQRSGQLAIVTLVPGTPVGAISASDMVIGSFYLADTTEVRAGIKLGYCRNYAVESKIELAIPQAHKDILEREWQDVVLTDSATKTKYKLHSVPQRQETLLVSEADATTEATRRLNFWKVKHKIFSFVGLPQCLVYSLGDTITLTYPAHGLHSGVNGVIISQSYDWFTYRVTIQVLI